MLLWKFFLFSLYYFDDLLLALCYSFAIIRSHIHSRYTFDLLILVHHFVTLFDSLTFLVICCYIIFILITTIYDVTYFSFNFTYYVSSRLIVLVTYYV